MSDTKRVLDVLRENVQRELEVLGERKHPESEVHGWDVEFDAGPTGALVFSVVAPAFRSAPMCDGAWAPGPLLWLLAPNRRFTVRLDGVPSGAGMLTVYGWRL